LCLRFLSLPTLLVAVLSATTDGKVVQVVAMASKCRARPKGGCISQIMGSGLLSLAPCFENVLYSWAFPILKHLVILIMSFK
jgi:hypothetical protein